MATRTSGRIVLSKNPKENLELAQKIFAKHKDLGASSPLSQLEGYDLTTISGQVQPTLQAHLDAESFKQQMEKAYSQRDAQFPVIKEAMSKCIALLKATYADNAKKLGDWGISVDDSKQNKPPKTQ